MCPAKGSPDGEDAGPARSGAALGRLAGRVERGHLGSGLGPAVGAGEGIDAGGELLLRDDDLILALALAAPTGTGGQ